MRLRFMTGLAVALAIALASPVRAQENDFNRPGAYAGLGGVYAVSAFQGPLKDLFGNSMGFQARGGYRFDEIFAVEGLYEYIDDFGLERGLGRGGIWMNHASVNGKLILPLDRFQPYLSGGVGFLNANASTGGAKWAFAGRFSAGTDLAITEHVALFLDAGYLVPAGGGVASDLQYFSFGWGGKYLF
jgi:opacity protein-like surface antigen